MENRKVRNGLKEEFRGGGVGIIFSSGLREYIENWETRFDFEKWWFWFWFFYGDKWKYSFKFKWGLD